MILFLKKYCFKDIKYNISLDQDHIFRPSGQKLKQALWGGGGQSPKNHSEDLWPWSSETGQENRSK